MEILCKVENPNKFTKKEQNCFLEMLILQNQVANPSIENIAKCHYICIAYKDNMPVGIGAIKNVYKTPFYKAGVPDLKKEFDLELGYIYVLDKEEFRGKGIAKSICKSLLEKVYKQRVFATTEESSQNVMNFILQKFGFEKTGKTYVGSKTGKKIGLYLLWDTKTYFAQ